MRSLTPPHIISTDAHSKIATIFEKRGLFCGHSRRLIFATCPRWRFSNEGTTFQLQSETYSMVIPTKNYFVNNRKTKPRLILWSSNRGWIRWGRGVCTLSKESIWAPKKSIIMILFDSASLLFICMNVDIACYIVVWNVHWTGLNQYTMVDLIFFCFCFGRKLYRKAFHSHQCNSLAVDFR